MAAPAPSCPWEAATVRRGAFPAISEPSPSRAVFAAGTFEYGAEGGAGGPTADEKIAYQVPEGVLGDQFDAIGTWGSTSTS